jgi:formate-dependent nitrite reductase membrane component NrfD
LATIWLFQGLTQAVVSSWVVWSAALFAIASACYSAFLFAQARGRDFWQSPLLVWHLLIQSISAGAAVLTLAGGLLGASVPMFYWLGTLLILSLVAGLAIIFTDLFMVHGGEEIMRATELLLKGGLSGQFWLFVVGLGIVAPIVLILWPSGSLQVNMIASVLVLIGSWMYENLWIKAGQSVPLS